MQSSSSRPRSRSCEKAQRSSVLSSANTKKSSISPKFNNKTMPISSDSSDSKPIRGIERKSPSKTSPLNEKRSVRAMDMLNQISQLQEELKKEREEKSKAIEELSDLKKKLFSQTNPIENCKSRVEILEREVEKAKESERKMLESLVFQTKQLEQTKISLEEAKLEIRFLQESTKREHFLSLEQEIRNLRNRLKSTIESEEKSKKAIDDLAIALTDVTAEARQVKNWLSETESELQKSKAETGELKALLETSESKLKLVMEETERLKFEREEMGSACSEKEKLFINCMKESEEEINKAREENTKLIDSQRVIREENARLRDLLKQAVNEATVVKESLEIARNENSQLNDRLIEKERAFQTVKQDYESLKVSEASARDSLKELESMLDTTTTTTTPTPKREETEEERVNGETVQIPKNRRRFSIGETNKFNTLEASSTFSSFGVSDSKDRMFASLSNVCDLRATTHSVVKELDGEFDYIDPVQINGMDLYTIKQRKKPVLRRFFGDMFRRKSFHKSNFSPTVGF